MATSLRFALCAYCSEVVSGLASRLPATGAFLPSVPSPRRIVSRVESEKFDAEKGATSVFHVVPVANFQFNDIFSKNR